MTNRVSGRWCRQFAAAFWMSFATVANAATVTVEIADASGAAARDAVVYAEPAGGRVPQGTAKGAVIDQISKEFVPRVSVMQAGASVRFPNKDNIRHHVYSFSPAKSFELKLYSGVPAQPVAFDKPGTVVLGCNIHDKMVAYVLVVDTPHFTKTDDSGRARFEGLPAGEYEIKAWQPLADGTEAIAAQRIKVAADAAQGPVVTLVLKAAAAPSR